MDKLLPKGVIGVFFWGCPPIGHELLCRAKVETVRMKQANPAKGGTPNKLSHWAGIGAVTYLLDNPWKKDPYDPKICIFNFPM